MKYRNESNAEFIARLMDYSEYGPITQILIIDAIGKQAQIIIDNAAEVRESMKNSIIHPDAYIGAAKEILAELETR